jgi:hypothetical protein
VDRHPDDDGREEELDMGPMGLPFGFWVIAAAVNAVVAPWPVVWFFYRWMTVR